MFSHSYNKIVLKHYEREKEVMLKKCLFSLILFTFFLVCKDTYGTEKDSIVILHTNDMHGHIVEGENGELGYAKMAYLIKTMRDSYPSLLLVDTGDVLHGTNFVSFFKGESAVMIMNKLKYDAVTLGNHDFNYGMHLSKLETMMNFPILSANITKKGEPIFKPYMIKSVKNKKIAFIGVTSTETKTATSFHNTKGLAFKDERKTVQHIVNDVRKKADAVVLLSHSGITKDREIGDYVKGVDLIIGGHSHTCLEDLEKRKYAAIAQACEHGKALGKVELIFNGKILSSIHGELLKKKHWVEKDEDINTLISMYNKKVEKHFNKKVGYSFSAFKGERKTLRTKETPLGYYLADILKQSTGADIGFINGGAIRDGWPQGVLTRGDIYNVIPFEDRMVTFQAEGADIKKALENSVSRYPKEYGGFLHASGLSFAFKSEYPKGKRVRNVKVGGIPLQEKESYLISTTSFLANGGDGVFTGTKKIHDKGALQEEIIHYLSSQVRSRNK
jgi:5'-nucleotidase